LCVIFRMYILSFTFAVYFGKRTNKNLK
jgi:hypothetical protein